jgi:hypothetical protein
MEDLKMIAEELIRAVKSGDTDSLVSSLKAFLYSCDDDSEDGEEKLASGGEVQGTGDHWQYGNWDDENSEEAQDEEAEYFGERY